jgi:hypothetical protein
MPYDTFEKLGRANDSVESVALYKVALWDSVLGREATERRTRLSIDLTLERAERLRQARDFLRQEARRFDLEALDEDTLPSGPRPIP